MLVKPLAGIISTGTSLITRPWEETGDGTLREESLEGDKRGEDPTVETYELEIGF